MQRLWFPRKSTVISKIGSIYYEITISIALQAIVGLRTLGNVDTFRNAEPRERWGVKAV